MGKTITFGIQKGGTGKSTTSAITAYLLAKAGYRILAIDLDSQGNMTELLTLVPSKEFKEQSIAEAIEDGNFEGKIIQFEEIPGLHLVPANDDLAGFTDYVYAHYMDLNKGKVQYNAEGRVKLLPEANTIIKRLIEPVKDQYHYIIIDTPPNLSRITSNALTASDLVVVIFESEKFCYYAIENFMETIDFVQLASNPDLKVGGILPNLNDQRRFDHASYVQKAKEKYGSLVFESTIRRRATIGRLPDTGFVEDSKLAKDLEQYKDFIKELLHRDQ